MNEQLIKDLARKAGLIAPYGSDREGLRDFDYRMFAELIVRECVDTAFHRGHPDLEFLLKHFGVEE